jgi:hypothetical protein
MDRRDILLAAAAAFAAARVPSARAAAETSGPSAAGRVDALLEAMGGRAAWAAARGYAVEARHLLATEPSPIANRILLDFRAPRVRIESARPSGTIVRILDHGRGWRLAPEGARQLTQAEVEDDRRFWTGNVYRTLHRLAARARELSVEAATDERILVRQQGEPLIWYRLNAAGEPVAFGPGADPAGTIFGPLVRFGPLEFPAFSVRDGGRWRALIDRFVVDPDLSDENIRRGVPGDLVSPV